VKSASTKWCQQVANLWANTFYKQGRDIGTAATATTATMTTPGKQDPQRQSPNATDSSLPMAKQTPPPSTQRQSVVVHCRSLEIALRGSHPSRDAIAVPQQQQQQ
jgi:hypothetical protein